MPCCVPRCVPEPGGALRQRLVRFPKDYRLRKRWKEVIKQATGIALVEPLPSGQNPAPLELCLVHMARPEETDRYQEPARFMDSSGSPLTLLGCRLCLQFVPAHESITTDGDYQLGGQNLVTAIQRLFGIRIRPDDFQRTLCLGCLAKLELVMAVRNQYRINEFVYETVRKASRCSLEIIEEAEPAVEEEDSPVDPVPVVVEKKRKRKKAGKNDRLEGVRLELVADEINVETMGHEFGEKRLEELTLNHPMTSVGKRKKGTDKGKIAKDKIVEESKLDEIEIFVETINVETMKDDEPNRSANNYVKDRKLDKMEILREALGDEIEEEELQQELFEELEMDEYLEESSLEDDHNSEDEADPDVTTENGNKKKTGSASKKNVDESKLDKIEIFAEAINMEVMEDDEPNRSANKHVKEPKLNKMEILREALGEEIEEEDLQQELFEELEMDEYLEESSVEADRNSENEAEPAVAIKKGNKKEKVGSKKNAGETKQDTVNPKLVLSTTCFICKGTFSNRSELELHLSLEHISEDGYTCAECNDGEKFIMVQTYNLHLSHHDHSIRRFKCNFCSMAFSVRNSLRLHENKKHGQSHRLRERNLYQVNCDICGKSFAHQGNMWRHKKQAHGQYEGHKCAICNRELTTRVSLQQHMLTHSDKRHCPYSCDHCEKRFKYVSQLRMHKLKWHQAVMNDYLCFVCQSRFTSMADYEIHMRELHVQRESYEYSCRLCPEIPQTDQELAEHIETSHASANYPYFKCSSCPSKFRTKNQLFIHRKNDHGTFVCDRCGGSYSTKMSLQQHIAYKHLGKQLPRSKTAHTRVKCEECGLVCSNIANMRRHQKVVHQGAKPFECSWCQTRFAAKLSLENHVRCAHTGDSPFECQRCGERFKETSVYSRHRKKCALEGGALKGGDPAE